MPAALSRHFGVPSIALDEFAIEPATIALVSQRIGRAAQRMLPVSRAGADADVAMADPASVAVIDDVRFTTGCNVEVVVAHGSRAGPCPRSYTLLPWAADRAPQRAGCGLARARGRRRAEPAEGDVAEDLEEISAAALARQGRMRP